MSNTRYVPTLPPTYNVQDPAVREFLDALSNAWELRSGQSRPDSDERYITKGELKEATEESLTQLLGGGASSAAGGVPGSGNLLGNNNQIIDNLAQAILNSALFQALGEQINTNLNLPSVFTRIGEVEAVASQIQTEQITTNSVVKGQFTLLGGRVGDAEAAITNEQTIRVNKDNALAAAVNNIWARIGGSTAAITDSQLASVTPSSAAATRWNQVVAAVTDPNTGQVNSASIVQELDTFSSNVNGQMNASYTVRAQVSTGGQTVVGGFGLMATAGAGSAAGPTIDFGVRADKFFIAATSATPNLSTQLSASDYAPFVVVTTNTNITSPGGQTTTYTPGVYMNRARVKELYGTYIEAGAFRAGEIFIGNAPLQNRTSTIYRDNKSTQQMNAVAQTTFQGSLLTGYDSGTNTVPIHTASTFMLYGPDRHTQTSSINQRCRNTDNNILIPGFVSVTATVDHFLSLWYRYIINGVAQSWVHLQTITEQAGSYGSVAITYGSLFSLASTEQLQFGIASGNSSLNPWNSGAVDIRDFTCSIQAVNI